MLTQIMNHDDVMMPLALTVIIDNKVRDPELFEFRRQANALFGLFGLSELSPDDTLSWFETHEKTIRETLQSRGKNTAILRALTQFKEQAQMEAMYDAMVTISISDDEYKREESDLIKSAASIWGFQRPPIKVDD